jgi:serine-type D-Ala-D-Ala carboxypeptidase (penicillin-binding protein 5/6)
MTFYTVYHIAIEKNISLTKESIIVDEEDSEMTGTTAALLPGDMLTIEELLYALMLPSGNDAAVCLAKWGGTLINSAKCQMAPISSFVYRMNRYAKHL